MSINTDYKIGLKREVVEALRPMFGSNFEFEDLRNHVYVGLEYPMTRVQYPAIYITFQEEELRNVGIGHYELDYTVDQLYPKIIKRWYFTGQLNFNVIALNALDRDRISAALVNMIAFGEVMPEFSGFWNEIRDQDYVAMAPLLDRMITGGEAIGAVPWESEDELQFGNSYGIKVYGEFWSKPESGDLILIDQIDLYPYREGEQEPHWV